MTKINLPRVIAHRGASGHAPENTLASFQRAQELGIEWVEFDVQLAKCGELVVIHDDELSRTTNGHGYVSRYTYPELCQLDAGSWFSDEYVGERIPRLIDVIDFLSQAGMGANIELKSVPGKERQTTAEVINTVQKAWPGHLTAPLFSSFNLTCLASLYELAPSFHRGLLLQYWRDDWLNDAKQYACVSVHVRVAQLTAAFVAEIKAHNYRVLSYTVNRAPMAQQLFAWGVDAVFSDYPERIT